MVESQHFLPVESYLGYSKRRLKLHSFVHPTGIVVKHLRHASHYVRLWRYKNNLFSPFKKSQFGSDVTAVKREKMKICMGADTQLDYLQGQGQR